MNSPFSSRFSTHSISSARPFIAVSFSLCFFSRLCSGIARADATTEAIEDETTRIREVIEFMNDDLVRIRDEITGEQYSSRNPVSQHDLLYSILRAIQTNTTQSASFVDYLNANPWWNTNSCFAPVWESWSSRAPRPVQIPMSFPEVISTYMSTLNREDFGDDWADNVDLFGVDSVNNLYANMSQGFYTWFDWVADAFKSNWTASTFSSLYDLTNEVRRPHYTGDEEESPTNAPLPSYSLPNEVAPDISAALDFDASELTAPTDGDPAFVVIPALSAGGVTVNARVFSFASIPASVRYMVPVVMAWLWRVLFVVALWHLVKVEWGYWSTLGNSEGSGS